MKKTNWPEKNEISFVVVTGIKARSLNDVLLNEVCSSGTCTGGLWAALIDLEQLRVADCQANLLCYCGFIRCSSCEK